MRLDKRWACLSVEDGYLDTICVGGKTLNPSLGHFLLPLLTTTPVPLHDFGRRHTDAVEEVAAHTRHPACLEGAHGGGLPGARSADHEEKRGFQLEDGLSGEYRCLTPLA